MAEKPAYAGKVSHSGSQKVEAPLDKAGKKRSVTKKEGSDLRTNKSGMKK